MLRTKDITIVSICTWILITDNLQLKLPVDPGEPVGNSLWAFATAYSIRDLIMYVYLCSYCKLSYVSSDQIIYIYLDLFVNVDVSQFFLQKFIIFIPL